MTGLSITPFREVCTGERRGEVAGSVYSVVNITRCNCSVIAVFERDETMELGEKLVIKVRK